MVLRLVKPMIPVPAICLCSLYKNGGEAVRVLHAEGEIGVTTACAQQTESAGEPQDGLNCPSNRTTQGVLAGGN